MLSRLSRLSRTLANPDPLTNLDPTSQPSPLKQKRMP